MGYRSDVAYTIRFEDDNDTKAMQTFYTFLAEAKSKPEYAFAITEVTINEKKRQINYALNNTKWYESFPEVASHKALWAMAEEYSEQDNNCIAGVYAEIGEDDNDSTTERIGDGDFSWVHVMRKIVTDWDEENT
jgi:hypothetical protein